MVRLCELRDKEVINVCDGERLGNVCDIDFDEKTGQICITPYSGTLQGVRNLRSRP